MAPEYAKEALLHDAAEAYVGDVIKPLKVILGNAYAEIESRFMAAIIERFNLDESNLLAVKNYDRQAIEVEHSYLQKGELNLWATAMQGLSMPCAPLLPDDAEALFLSQYHSLKI